MKRNYPKWQLMLLLIFSFAQYSCLKLVSDQFPAMDPVPTVNACLRTGDTLTLHLSLAGTIDTSEIKYVDNATIDVYVNGKQQNHMTYDSDGWYASDVVVKEGKEYQCDIFIPGFDTVRCREFIPLAKPILDIVYIDTAGFDEEGHSYAAFEITFPNNLNEPDYYEVKIHKIPPERDDDFVFPRYWSPYSSDYMSQIEDPVFFNEGIAVPVFSDEIMTDSVYTLHYNYYRDWYRWSCHGEGCTVYSYPEFVELRTVSEGFYLYKKQLELYEMGTYTGFEGTLATFPLYSNVENGYGIFSGYSYSQTDTIYPSYVQ